MTTEKPGGTLEPGAAFSEPRSYVPLIIYVTVGAVILVIIIIVVIIAVVVNMRKRRAKGWIQMRLYTIRF